MAQHELDFTLLLDKLRAWRDELEPALHAPQHVEAHAQALELKRQIEAARACLEFCEAHDLHPARLKGARVLPKTSCFGAEFRVMDDTDSGDCQRWLDPLINGEARPFYAEGGAVVV